MLDWGDGTYEHTAEMLAEAAKTGVLAAKVSANDRVLDLGCGTGNAALEAARLGARVVAIDPAERLLDVTRARAAREGLAIEVIKGDAAAVPAEDASFDAVVSIFAVIFADDADRAASEMLRVVRPGGRVVLTTWLARGALAMAGKALGDALSELAPAGAPRAAPRWGDEAFVRGLFEPRGAEVRFEEHAVVFEAESAEAWFAAQEVHHPVWRFARRALADRPESWDSVRARSLACLRAESEHPYRLRVTSPYLRVTVTR